MKDYLVFRLYGPMASWGQAAVGGDRPTGIQPSRSALLGLLGAALGIKRDDEEQLWMLQASVVLAVKHCFPSTLVRDFHTSQVPIGNYAKLGHCKTRKMEIMENDFQAKYSPKNSRPNAILSKRDYRCDGLWVVVISLTDTAELTLQQIQKALLQPVYPLCLGRKSCPPALPLMPRIIQNQSLKAALDTSFPPLISEKSDRFWLGTDGHVTYFWEGEKKAFAHDGILTTHPWDEPVHRGRWQLKQRVMHQLTMREG